MERYITGKYISCWMLLAVLLAVGCSDDAEESRRSRGVMVKLAPYAADYTQVEALTRALEQPVWAPSGYYKYSSLTGINDHVKSNDNAAICVYFTQNEQEPQQRKFRYSNDSWLIDEVIDAGIYQLYGFVPFSGADVNTTQISPFYDDDMYSRGVKMELKGMNSVMDQDVCVVVGAGYKDKTSGNIVPNPLKAGTFDCWFKTSNDANADNDNEVYLLFEHLYAALRFRFRLGEEYSRLRSIHLKSLELMAFRDPACEHPMTSKVNTTVLLRANDDGEMPIVGEINFNPEGDDEMSWQQISSGDVELPSDRYTEGEHEGEYKYTDDLGFVPKTSSCYMLRSTYDVYDKEGNKIRSGCMAVNKIDPRQLFNLQSLNRGCMYTLRFTVQPTYLYVLSDPDLDNPTMVME